MPEREYYTAYPRPILWLVPGGEVEVGGPEADARPAFEATVEPFYLSKLPVSNEQFEAFDPGFERSPVSPGDRDPAVGVSWYDAAEYCAWYAEVARKPIRLPTEIEWEHACRGGEADPTGMGGCASDELAWHRGNSAGGARMPALDAKGTNGFGLHAMLGGVWEWTGSVYRPYPLAGEEPVRDGEPDDVPRVLRGGSFREHLQEITCSARRAEPPGARFDDAGFRIARTFR